MRLTLPLALIAPLPALAEPPQIVTDIAPIHSLVSQVVGDLATPSVLVDSASNPHSMQLKPSQARALSNADLVVWVGPEMEPWLSAAIDSLTTDGHILTLLDAPGTELREFGEDEDEHHDHDDDHGGDAHAEEDDHHDHDEEEHGEEAHGEDDDHHHDGTDPHAWLSPHNAAAWLAVIAEEIAAIDPENAATYASNAAKAIADLEALDADLMARFDAAGSQDYGVVTFHDAFHYFTEHYGVKTLGSVKPGDASTPSAAAISELRDIVSEHDGAVCVYGEPGFDPGLLRAIGEESGVGTGVLDATGSELPLGASLYGALITGAAEQILSCVEG